MPSIIVHGGAGADPKEGPDDGGRLILVGGYRVEERENQSGR